MPLDSEIVNRLARASGFAQAAIAPAPHPSSQTDRDYLEAWIAAGHSGGMGYLERRNGEGELLRSSLHDAVPWARSVIICAAPYHAEAPLSTDPAPPDSGWIARYAWSGTPTSPQRPADYHKVLLARLKDLEAALHRELESEPTPEPLRTWAYVDTGPLIERAWARRAGLSWTGKNTCTLSQQLGSFFFLGVILTSLELRPGLPIALAADRCGSCTRCLDACPTDALIAPYQMDAGRCIAYLTIEHRGPVPEGLRPLMGRQVFGCDICQDVCPWNRKAPHATDPLMLPREALINPSLSWLAQLTNDDFARIFHGSPVKRARFAGLRRNVAIAMANSGDRTFVAQLEAWSCDADPTLAETARWAILHLEGATSAAGPPAS